MDDRSGGSPLSDRRPKTNPNLIFLEWNNFPRPSPPPAALPLHSCSSAKFPADLSQRRDAALPAASSPAAGWSRYALRAHLQSLPPTRTPPLCAHRSKNVPGFPSASRLLFRARASPVPALPPRTTSAASVRKRVFPIPSPPAQSARACDLESPPAPLQYPSACPAFRGSRCSAWLSAGAHLLVVAFPPAAPSPARDRMAACPALAQDRAPQSSRSDRQSNYPARQILFLRSPSPRRTAPQCSGSID